MKITHALSVKQPWPYAMRELGKDVENRRWPLGTRFLNVPIAIHASIAYDKPGAAWIRQTFQVSVPEKTESDKGCIVGVAIFSACQRNYSSRWSARGQFQFVISQYTPIEPVQCKGALTVWPFRVLHIRQAVERNYWRALQADKPFRDYYDEDWAEVRPDAWAGFEAIARALIPWRGLPVTIQGRTADGGFWCYYRRTPESWNPGVTPAIPILLYPEELLPVQTKVQREVQNVIYPTR